MPKDWKDLTDDEILNFDGAHTAKMSQYDRIMRQKNIMALNSLRDKVAGLIETIYRASQGTQKKAENLISLFEKSAKSQSRQQIMIIFLTVVIVVCTISYTLITYQSVSAMRDSNRIQIQMLELEKEQLKIGQKTKT